jgi:hypothetical protein
MHRVIVHDDWPSIITCTQGRCNVLTVVEQTVVLTATQDSRRDEVACGGKETLPTTSFAFFKAHQVESIQQAHAERKKACMLRPNKCDCQCGVG